MSCPTSVLLLHAIQNSKSTWGANSTCATSLASHTLCSGVACYTYLPGSSCVNALRAHAQCEHFTLWRHHIELGVGHLRMSCDYNYFPTRKHCKPVDSEANMKWKRSLGHCRRFIITHYGCHFSFSFIIFACCAVAFLASPTVGGDTKTEQGTYLLL